MNGETTVVLLGAGGHARVCLEALHSTGGYQVAGAISDDGTAIAGLGVPMLGTDEDISGYIEQGWHGFVAIGVNAARRAVAERWLAAGGRLATAISSHAVVSPTVAIGPGSAVFPGAVVNPATVIGSGAIVNTNASIDHDCAIGDYVHVAPGVAIAGGVTIGRDSLVGIGARIIPGITVGAGAVIGAGAVVVRDVAAGATVAGNPARPLAVSSVNRR